MGQSMARLARVVMYGGIVAIVLGLSKLHAAAIAVPPYDFTESFRLLWSLAFVGLVCLTAYGFGLPDVPGIARSPWLAGIASAAAASMGISGAQLVLGTQLLPRFVVSVAALLTVPLFAACAGLASGSRDRAFDRDRVVVVTGAGEADELAHELDDQPERPAHIVARLSTADASAGTSRRLVELVSETAATVVVLDRAAQVHPRVVDQAAELHAMGVRVRTLSLFYEEWLGKLPVGELEQVSMLFDIGELHRERYGRVTRLFDIALGLMGMALLATILPFVLIGNAIANRGPLLYRQQRVGKGGVQFTILKFRTMRPDGDSSPVEWTSAKDPRITPFGQVLRRTHIDELPQFLNTVRGDLSIVGPRPEQPHYVAELSEKLPFYRLRHLVRPGLTGWAQVKYGYAGDERDALQKLQYEFFYLRRQSLRLDALVAARTLRAIVRAEGR